MVPTQSTTGCAGGSRLATTSEDSAEGLFSLYRALSDEIAAGRALPPLLSTSLALIRRAALAEGGSLTMRGVMNLRPKLARMMALAVAGERASGLALASLEARRAGMASSQDRPSRQEIGLEMLAHLDSPAAAISAAELTESWAAKAYCRMLLNHCTPRDLKALAAREGGDIYLAPGAQFQGAFHERHQTFSRHFRERSRAIARDLSVSPGIPAPVRVAALHQVEEDRYYASAAMLASGADLADAATECGEEASAVYRQLMGAGTGGTSAYVPPQPHDGHRYDRELAEGGQGLLTLDAEARQRALGALPVMAGVQRALLEERLLEPSALEHVEIGMRDHLTPVVEQLLRRLCDLGARHVHVSGKGESTVPLVASAMRYRAVDLDTGIGDGRFDAAQLLERSRSQILRWAGAAARKGYPLLIIGDGYETARAAHEAATIARRRNSRLRIGYVAITQSDLNYLREAAAGPSGLQMDVTSLAGTVLKDIGTSQPIADWIVAHEGDWISSQNLPALSESRIVIVGGGNIGAALAKALVAQGCRQIQIVDPEPDAVRARLDPSLEGIEVSLRQGTAPLPSAGYYFSAVGRPCVIDRSTMQEMPDGAVVFNCASRNELDEGFLGDARRGRHPWVCEAGEREPHLLPEHRTLALSFRPRPGCLGSTVLLRRNGQPAFDGVEDKDVPTIDVTFAGALAASAEALARLRGPSSSPELRFLSRARQERVILLAEDRYGLDLAEARRALAAGGAS